jgi:hypothetical protein
MMTKRNFDEEYESNEPLIGQAALAEIADCQPGIITPRGEVCSVETQAVRQEVNESEGSATFVVVTRGKEENRHGNKVHIKENKFGRGLIVDQYIENPIVLFEHGHVTPLPMGMAQKEKGAPVELRMNSTKAISKVYFNQGVQIVEDVANLVFSNAIRMASIGFNVQKVMRLKRKQKSMPEGVEDVTQYFGGMDFVESMLMEWSITVLGADPGALKQSVSRKAVNGHSLSERMVQYLSAAAGPITKQNQSGFNGWSALWDPDNQQTQSAFWMPEDDEPEGGESGQRQQSNGSEVLQFTREEFREIISTEVQTAIDKIAKAGESGAEAGEQHREQNGAGVDNNPGNPEIQQSETENVIPFDQIEKQFAEQREAEQAEQLTAEQIATAVTQSVNDALEPRFRELESNANKFEQQLQKATGQLTE